MKNLCDLLGLKKAVGDVGIEIEAEGRGMEIVDSDRWRTERDGSLRGEYPQSCAEFILKKPIPIKDVRSAITELVEALPNAKFAFSFRTSVHVHVNVQSLSLPELSAFVYSALLLEEPMMNYCGEGRKANRFCLRMQDAEGFYDYLVRLMELNPERAFKFNENEVRYANINIGALNKYGSLEFRGMRGNIEEPIIGNWCEALVQLREFSRGKTPVDVYNMFISMSPEDFLKTILDKKAKVFQYATLVEDINRSFSLSIDLPHIFHRAAVKWANEPKLDLKALPKEDIVEEIQYLRALGYISEGEHEHWMELSKVPRYDKTLRDACNQRRMMYGLPDGKPKLNWDAPVAPEKRVYRPWIPEGVLVENIAPAAPVKRVRKAPANPVNVIFEDLA